MPQVAQPLRMTAHPRQWPDEEHPLPAVKTLSPLPKFNSLPLAMVRLWALCFFLKFLTVFLGIGKINGIFQAAREAARLLMTHMRSIMTMERAMHKQGSLDGD